MARDSNVVLDIDALDSLPKSGIRREIVLSLIRDLSWSSHLGGDISFKAERLYEVSIVAGFAVTWWVDAPVNEIRVVDIRPAS